MNRILEIVGIVLIFCAVLAFAFLIGVYLIAFIVLFVVIGVISQIAGIPITVTRDGVEVGQLRRFRYVSRASKEFWR